MEEKCRKCGISTEDCKVDRWAHPAVGEWTCDTCIKKSEQLAIKAFQEDNPNYEPDQLEDRIICPFCGYGDGGGDLFESDGNYKCGECSSVFVVEVEYEKTFSMRFKHNK